MTQKRLGLALGVAGLFISAAAALGFVILKAEHWRKIGLPSASLYWVIAGGMAVWFIGTRIQKGAEVPEDSSSATPVRQSAGNWWTDKVGGVILALGIFLWIMAVILRRTLTPQMWALSGLHPATILLPMIGGAALFFVGLRMVKKAEKAA